MPTKHNEFLFPSKSGLADIHAQSFEPESRGEVIGIFQIAHGMAEHSERYREFAQHLCSRGYAVFLSDHIGHGKSVSDNEHLGYFGEEKGEETLVEDIYGLTLLIKAKYPQVPIFLFGHSMGSFVARSYASKYGNELTGTIFCGTSGPNPGASIGALIASVIADKKGAFYRSEFINNLAFGSYNKKIKPSRTPFDWLTRDESIVDAYIADPLCGYLFTAAGYRDMFKLLKQVSAKTWYKQIPSDLNILLISGNADPVGDYGKGVNEVYKLLKSSAHSFVSLKLYDDCRHEILNELNRQDVYSDIADWSDSVLEKIVFSEKA